MYSGNIAGSLYGGLASGVPSELRGLQYIHEKWGQLNWKEVVMPAVHVARDGWKVGEDLVRFMDGAQSGVDGDFLTKWPEWAIDFAPNGTRLGLGDRITRKRYADTLERIAEEGPDAFYEGPMAEAMIRTLREKNGTMTMQDLKDYKVVLRKPATIKYRGHKLTSNSAPAGGVVAMAVMNIVGGYEDFGEMKTLNLSTHRLDEAMRFGYGMVPISQNSTLQKTIELTLFTREQTLVIPPSSLVFLATRMKCFPLKPALLSEPRSVIHALSTCPTTTHLVSNHSRRQEPLTLSPPTLQV
jgi:gamma-glutamyltranspeptidase/glutathione hydrolase